jgi:hypothetical protein
MENKAALGFVIFKISSQTFPLDGEIILKPLTEKHDLN